MRETLDPLPRPSRWARVVLSLGLGALLLWMMSQRCTQSGGAYDAEIRQGVAALEVALSRRDSDFTEARRHFEAAARLSVADTFGRFGLSVLDELAGGAPPLAESAPTGYVEGVAALRDGDYQRARTTFDGVARGGGSYAMRAASYVELIDAFAVTGLGSGP